MLKLAAPVAAAAALAAGLAIAATPAQAQSGRGLLEVIVYGNDPCPRSSDDEVVVCARRPETERYRIAEELRPEGPRQQRRAWVNQAGTLETVSDTGIYSCSAVGPAGYTGCLEQLIKQSQGERREQTAGDTPPE
jgi:hypothetical protein